MGAPLDTIIIGAGTAGLAALREVRKRTDRYLIVNDGPWGTTCARVGCMPSKMLIEAASTLHRRHVWNELGLRGATALMYAARNNQLEVARALMDAGARPNLQSDAKATALSIAVQHGHQPVADLLRQRGAMLPGGH